MTAKTAGQIQEIGGQIEKVAGKKVSAKVMEGSEAISKSNDRQKVAL